VEYAKCKKGHSFIDLDCFMLQGMQVLDNMAIQMTNFLKEKSHYSQLFLSILSKF